MKRLEQLTRMKQSCRSRTASVAVHEESVESKRRSLNADTTRNRTVFHCYIPSIPLGSSESSACSNHAKSFLSCGGLSLLNPLVCMLELFQTDLSRGAWLKAVLQLVLLIKVYTIQQLCGLKSYIHCGGLGYFFFLTKQVEQCRWLNILGTNQLFWLEL